MQQFIEKHKKKLILLLCAFLLVSAALTSGRTRALPTNSALGFIITPLQKAVTNIAGFVGDRLQAFTDKRDLATENQALLAQIEALEAENKRLQLYAEENERLSGLLQIARQYADYTTTGAHVIAKDPGNWFDTFLIDKGSLDGIAGDMALLTSEGIVGRVVEAGASYAKAQSILDPNSSVSAKSLRTGDISVVKGDYTLMGDGLCRMEYIDASAQIIEGDEIVTSSLSDIFPAGIPIGIVKEIKSDSNGLTKYAIIEPFADLKHLETLLVVTGEASEPAEAGEAQ